MLWYLFFGPLNFSGSYEPPTEEQRIETLERKVGELEFDTVPRLSQRIRELECLGKGGEYSGVPTTTVLRTGEGITVRFSGGWGSETCTVAGVEYERKSGEWVNTTTKSL